MIKVIIIDDEPNNTAYIKELLQEHFSSIHIVAISNDAKEGLSLINELQPQLVFIDVEMPGLSGFDVLHQLEPLKFEVIFITAYNHYAMQAFEVNAVGYLTKPLQTDKFIKTTAIAIQKIETEHINKYLFSMLQASTVKETNNKIALPTQNGLIFINAADIMYCRSSGNYTRFFTKNEKEILVSRQLGEFEKLLPEDTFLRIHDQYIVQLQYIKEYIRGRGGELVLENNDSLPVSTNRKEAFLLRFDKWLRKK